MVYLIRRLVDDGFANKVLISIDVNWVIHDDGNVELEAETVNPECRKRNYAYLLSHTVPMLEEAGLDRKTIDVFLIENPREILTPFKP